MHAHIVDAFTTIAGTGNRAGIVLAAAELSEDVMQRAARAVAASETAFCLNVSAAGSVALRFFTPHREIAFCGHATVAALHLLHERGVLPAAQNLTLECPAGALPIVREDASAGFRAWIRTPAQPWTKPSVEPSELLRALGGEPDMLDDVLPIEQSGTKLFVPLSSRAALFALSPHWSRLEAMSPRGIDGFCVFTRDTIETQSSAHSRYFAPSFGIREDPVTGSASGPLGAYLVRHSVVPGSSGKLRLRLEQGDCMDKPGRVDVEVENDGHELAARIAGPAVTVLSGELRL